MSDKCDLARFADRAVKQFQWLKENGGVCFDEQLHLNEGSQERIYWHYGYMVALCDVLCFLTGERPTTREPYILSRGTHLSTIGSSFLSQDEREGMTKALEDLRMGRVKSLAEIDAELETHQDQVAPPKGETKE
jgi:hypothetical protein